MSEGAPSRSGSDIVFWGGMLVLFIALAAAITYSFHEHRIAKQLTAQNNETIASLNATRSQVEALTAKLNGMSNAQTEKPSPSRTDSHHSTGYQGPVSRLANHRRPAEDPRWKQFQGRLDEQGQQIESTRQDLASTRTELQGSIARTHEELVLLAKKGERSYYEFDLDKADQFQHDGPVGIRLRKANTKHEYADLELLVDDLKLSRKHVNVYEPVMFYVADSRQPVELVINRIAKNHIHGYVSEPRYKASDLEAQATGDAANVGGRRSAPSPATSISGDPQLRPRN
jgi:uncharacterized coiled-coil protein SlyX